MLLRDFLNSTAWETFKKGAALWKIKKPTGEILSLWQGSSSVWGCPHVQVTHSTVVSMADIAHGCIHIHQYTAQLETHLSRIRTTNGYTVRKKLCSQRTWTTCRNWLSPHHTLNLSQLGSDKESTGGAVATNSNGMSQKRASNSWLPTQSEPRCSAWTEGLCSDSQP